MRVIFMGTPQIAATCLKAILDDGIEVVAVCTQPDRPRGRGMKMEYSPVKQLALERGLPVLQPESFREEMAAEQLRAYRPDVIAAVAYGRILPQRVLDIPPRGCINIHASLLPRYRGSAPYQWAVLDGCTETGVTAQFMAAKMDAGDVIDCLRTPIGENETAGELLERLSALGAQLLCKTLRRLENGAVPATPQCEADATFAPMLDKSMCPIDWNMTAQQVHDRVRGLHPWPIATMELNGKRFKLHETRVVARHGRPGEVLELTKSGLVVACAEGAVEIRRLQAEGGRCMPAADYFRGHPLEG